MKTPRYFFNSEIDDPEFCHSLEYYKQKIEQGEAEFYKLVEAIPETDKDIFFCREFFSAGLKSESDCGRSCKSYSPRNGKNGRCRFSTHCYTEGERIFIYYGKTLREVKP